MSKITVVIPCREGENADTTIESLASQTFQDFSIIVSYDENKGAQYARNKGFKKVNTEFVLFSDNDIEWKPEALEILLKTLQNNPEKSYAYCGYEMEGLIQCNVEFDENILKQMNYISTMSLIRTSDFPGFDEEIKRFQDWDLWLNMLSRSKTGVYCGKILFSTKPSGITKGDPTEAVNIIKSKWKL